MVNNSSIKRAKTVAAKLSKKGSLLVKKPSPSSGNKNAYINLQYHTHDLLDATELAEACNASVSTSKRGLHQRFTVNVGGKKLLNLLVAASPYMKQRAWLAEKMIATQRAIDASAGDDMRTVPKTCPCCGQKWPAAGVNEHGESLFV